MHHAYLDRFAGLDSPLHRLDPRAKTAALLALLAAVIAVPAGVWWPFAVAAAVALALCAAGGIPVGYLLKRIVVLSPFVLFSVALFPLLSAGDVVWSVPLGPWRVAVTRQGLELAGALAAKFALGVVLLGLLFSLTRFHDFLCALRRFRVPQLLVMQLGFLYRYLYVVVDEAERMLRARDARAAGRSRAALWRATTGLIGVLFLRSYYRSRRVYWAMLSRGFSGDVPTLTRMRLRAADLAFVALMLTVAAAMTVGWVVPNR